jgi:hypothetical protein
VTGLSWNANGKLLASASYSGAVTIWDLSASHDRRVQNVAKSSKRRQLQDTMLAANESETMSQHATCLSNINPCSALAFAPSNFSKNVTNLAVCRLNGQVQIYGVDVSRKSDKPLVSAHSYTNHTGPVLAAVWLDAHVLATCGVDGFVYVYDTQKDTIRHFKANTEVNTVRWLKPKIAKKGKKYNNKSREFSVDVKNQAVFLVAGDEAGVIYLLSCDEIVPGNKGSSSSASSSSSSSSSSNSNSKKRKQTDDNKQGSSSSSSSNSSEEGYMTALFTTQGHKRGVVTLAVNTQTEVAAVLNDGSDDEGAKPAPRSAGVAYTPLVVASGGLDTAVKVWEIDTTSKKLTEIYSFNNHIHPVTSVTFSAELPYLLASSSHDRVHAWNIKEGVMVRTFRPQEQEEGGVNSVQWADKGRKIAAAMSQGQVLVLDIIE